MLEMLKVLRKDFVAIIYELQDDVLNLKRDITILKRRNLETEEWKVGLDVKVHNVESGYVNLKLSVDEMTEQYEEVLKRLIRVENPHDYLIFKKKWKSKMITWIANHFNESEMESLCLDLGLNTGDIFNDSMTLKEMARSLLEYADRRQIVGTLFKQAAQLRPGVELPNPDDRLKDER